MTDTSFQGPPVVASARPRAWPMYRAVVGIGMMCGLAIVLVHESTLPIIQRKRVAMVERAITEVLPGATSGKAFRLGEDGKFESSSFDAEEGELIYAGYDENDALVGVALIARGMGYQDIVQILYGYSFEKQSILGISVLESRETPGLGDRIETDTVFQSNFGELDVSLTPDASAVSHPIEFVKPGEKTEAWQIDGISGATITSRATAVMLRESSVRWMPLIHPRQEDFQSPKQEE